MTIEIKCADCGRKTVEGDLQGLCVICSADHLVLMAEAEEDQLERMMADIDVDLELEAQRKS